jgi:hypothetical protein
VHPVALKYQFCGDLQASLSPALDDIERRLSWQPQRHVDLRSRVARVGRALVCLKEMEYFGAPQSGSIYRRIERLIDHLLAPKEAEWLGRCSHGDAVNRMKALRAAILPDMVRGEIAPEERDRRWRQLADLYLVQQLACYPRDYLRPDSSPERLIETVERYEEDLTDVARVHGPMKLLLQVGEAIEVGPERDRSGEVDPLIRQVETQLQAMIDGLAAEIAVARAA